MTTAIQRTCTGCGKKYVYHPSYSGRKPRDWGKSTRELCPKCKEAQCQKKNT